MLEKLMYELIIICLLYSTPEPVQTGIKKNSQGIPVWTGFTVYNIDSCEHFSNLFQHFKTRFFINIDIGNLPNSSLAAKLLLYFPTPNICLQIVLFIMVFKFQTITFMYVCIKKLFL